MKAAKRVESIDDLKADPHNPNRGTERGSELIGRSIEEVGLGRSIVSSSDGVVLAGNGTLKRAKAAGISKIIPVEVAGDALVVVVRTDLKASDPRARRLAVLDNQTGALGLAWDFEALEAIEAIAPGSIRGGDVPVFTEGEWDRMQRALRPVPPAPEPDGSEQPAPSPNGLLERAGELHTKWATRSGQVWSLRREGSKPAHRIIVGDCRDAKTVERLFGGSAVPLLVTDPPYCSGGFQEAGRSAGTFGDIASDQLSTRGYTALIQGMIAAAKPRAAYLFTDWRMWIPLFDVVESSGLPVRPMVVWDKGTPGMGSLWRTQHELVMFGSREGKKRDKGIAAYGNVIRANRTGNVNHYTEKPVDLLRRILEGDSASPRAACPVYDAFMGSGSLIFAAEALGRQAFGCEVEPKWVAVLLERAELAGLEPRLEK